MKSKLLALTLIVAMGGAVLAPTMAQPASAQSTRAHAAFFDKTRFVIHLGMAYFAFHHFVWTPYKKGEFASGAPHRVSTIAKAAIATLFAYHEAKVSYDIAEKSHSATLHALVAPLNKVMSAFNSAATKLKNGTWKTSDLDTLSNVASNFQQQASKNGYGFHDITVPITGT